MSEKGSSYASNRRDQMMQKIEKPFHPLNRRKHDPYDRFISIACLATGSLAAILILITFAYQIFHKFHG